MILVWILTMILITLLSKWYVDRLLKKQQIYIARFVITISCMIQFVVVYFLVKALVGYLVQGLNVFYR
ncbi:hypothetical protein M4L39_04805 [Staphylococcus equorum]|uniref:hypothetical protein n=1 Tax=Staphylococcus equorum TaxID=246432 RepID=UPI002407E005|nr:hypothetical protein [Staphylococcus equorum]MDG0842752.1 hypothetical protein [Staphylococcus equorum]